MAHRYFVWEADPVGAACVLLGLEGVADAHRLEEGETFGGDWPADAAFRMDPDHPRDTELLDRLQNRDRHVVVSSATRRVLEDAAVPGVEYLPVRIHDHDGAVAVADYVLVHPLGVVDCIDFEASDLEFHPADPGAVSCVDELVLRSDLAPPSELFRPRGLSRFVICHERIADLVHAAGLRGHRFTPVERFEF